MFYIYALLGHVPMFWYPQEVMLALDFLVFFKNLWILMLTNLLNVFWGKFHNSKLDVWSSQQWTEKKNLKRNKNASLVWILMRHKLFLLERLKTLLENLLWIHGDRGMLVSVIYPWGKLLVVGYLNPYPKSVGGGLVSVFISWGRDPNLIFAHIGHTTTIAFFCIILFQCPIFSRKNILGSLNWTIWT